MIDLYLGFVSVIRIFQPGDQRKNSYGHCHSQVSEHFSVVCKTKRNEPIQKTENDHQKLSEGIPFCTKDQRSHADQGCQ